MPCLAVGRGNDSGLFIWITNRLVIGKHEHRLHSCVTLVPNPLRRWPAMHQYATVPMPLQRPQCPFPSPRFRHQWFTNQPDMCQTSRCCCHGGGEIRLTIVCKGKEKRIKYSSTAWEQQLRLNHFTSMVTTACLVERNRGTTITSNVMHKPGNKHL